MGRPQKIVFIIPSLSGGGAERVILQVLQYIERRKIDAHLILFRKIGAFLDLIPSDIVVHSLSEHKYFWGFQWLIYFQYKQCISILKPDVVVSFMWYSNFIVLMEKLVCRSKHKIIISERYTLSLSYEGRITELIRTNVIRFLYPFADKVVVVSKAMSEELNRFYSFPTTKISVIYNPVDLEKIEKAAKEAIDHPWFRNSIPVLMAAGRLTPQKGFSYLIRTVSILKDDFPVRLIILGEGQERKNLQQLINFLDLKDQIQLVGFQKNPYQYLSRVTLFVLSSLYEGFPNALLEAMALGVPCIATRCPTGPEEIITDGMNGLLVPPGNEKALAEAIIRLLKDPALCKKLSEEGRKRAEDFRVEKIVKEYESLIDDVLRILTRD